MTAAATSAGPAPVAVPRRTVRTVFAGLMLAMLLASLDQTIVSTALPTIVDELSGLDHLSWVVTAYILASTVAGPVYGKLGDLYGRKRLFQLAIVIFLAGSALSGLSTSMEQLIAFRALQGLGGGGLIVLAQAIVGDVVSPRERGRYQGLFGAVFAVSSVAGPLLGGFFADELTWRWIFYINLPLGALALGVIAVSLETRPTRDRVSIDWQGASLLAGGASCLVLVTSLGGTTWEWASAQSVAAAALGFALLAAFVRVERRAAEPVVPLGLFGDRVFGLVAALAFIVGLALFGATTFLPLFFQVVFGQDPTTSGLQLLPLMAGVLVMSLVSGQAISRTGRYKAFPVAGTAVIALAFGLLSTMDAGTSPATVSIYLALLGIGLGMTMQVLVIAAQNSVGYRDLGVATSTTTFMRSMGGAIGVAAFGAIFANRLAAEPPGRAGYADALATVFLTAAPLAAVAFVLTWFLREVPLRETIASGSEGGGAELAHAHDPDTLRELERALCVASGRDARRRILERLATRAQVPLAPPQLWTLARVAERDGPVDVAELAAATGLPEATLSRELDKLRAGGWLAPGDGAYAPSPRGTEAYARLVSARRERLRELLGDWEPEAHEELAALISRLARDLVADDGARPRAAAREVSGPAARP